MELKLKNSIRSDFRNNVVLGTRIFPSKNNGKLSYILENVSFSLDLKEKGGQGKEIKINSYGMRI